MLVEFAGVLVRRDDLASFIRPLADARQQVLATMVTRRRRLVTMMLSERQRPQLTTAVVRPGIETMIEAIHKQLDDMEAHMTSHVQAHDAELDKLLRPASGIGTVASVPLIAELPELGKLNRREIASLVGVVRMTHDWANSKGRRCVQGERFEIRCARSTATLSAANPAIETFYDRQLNAGKLPKVTWVACMRELLSALNAMVKTNKPGINRFTAPDFKAVTRSFRSRICVGWVAIPVPVGALSSVCIRFRRIHATRPDPVSAADRGRALPLAARRLPDVAWVVLPRGFG